MALLLRELVREIEHRTSTQEDIIKKQNDVYEAREGKYRSRVRVLETLARGIANENEVAMALFQQTKMEKKKLEEKNRNDELFVSTLKNERDQRDAEIVALKQELEAVRLSNQKNCLELERQSEETKSELEKKLQDLECLLEHSRDNVKELEKVSESRIQRLKKKELLYRRFIDSQFQVLQVLRGDLDSVRREILKTRKCYPKEFQLLGMELKELLDAAENYHIVLEENRKLYNEVQDLKGNIRVYCRVRPFLLGQNERETTIEHIGENGELLITNPTKLGKDSRRLFKFNKVFAPTATQEEVFKDTQPLIRSVLDGYNVCIFAYGQTGSGKTYTMSGPDMSSRKDWGVNYRALHDLFQISQSRKSSIFILTVHVRGTELKSNSFLRGCLHLVDLAGSERVDRSEATGDRLREAQHINKSLSALGDVIFALAKKSSHVPYRNSKLTQVLQSSLGGQAKTLMFVQLNPDLESYSETISPLKFAKRVSGVELGAAHSNKEGKDVRELMEQLASLKEAISKKDEEIERLRFIKVEANSQKHGMKSPIDEASTPRRHSIGPISPVRGLGGVKDSMDKQAAMDQYNFSEYSVKHAEIGSQQRADELSHATRSFELSLIAAPEVGRKLNDDVDLLGFADQDSDERLSDISDSGLSVRTETDGSISSAVGYTLFPDVSKAAAIKEKCSLPCKVPKPSPKLGPSGSSQSSLGKASSKTMSSSKKVAPSNSSSTRPKSKPLKKW
ncbi:Kinesin-like protein [Drosera capensis]